jgi:broad specificity phosphatase PhoE
MPARLTLICHGATAATRMAAFPRDEPLEDGAAEQAAAMAGSLGRHHRAWTAPALGARQTAAALGLDATEITAIREWDFGRWVGQRLADVARNEPERLAQWRGCADAAPHGGETLSQVCRRVAEWLDEPMRQGGHSIAVTHAAVIRAAVLHALGAPTASFWRIDVEPLSVIDLRSDGGRWSLRFGA